MKMLKLIREKDEIDVSAQQSMNHKIFHQMLMSVMITFTIYCFFYHHKGLYLPSFIMAFGVIVLCPLSYLFNKSGKNNLSRLMLLLVGHSYIYLTSLIFHHKINNDVYGAPAFLMALVFFDAKTPVYLAISLILPIINWAMIKFADNIQFATPIDLNLFNLNQLNYLNFFGSAAMTISFVLIMIKSNKEKDYKIAIEQEARIKVKLALEEKTKTDKELKNVIHQLNEFFNTSPDLMAISDPKGHLMSVNPSFCSVLGYQEKELKNIHFISLVHPDDLLVTKDTIKKISRGETILNFENRCLCKDGTYKRISWSCQYTQEMTTIYGIIYGIGRDMTDLIKNREEKEQLRGQLEEAQSMADIGSWNYHVSNGQIRWSKQMFRLMGESPDALKPTFERMSEKIFPEDRALFLAHFKNSLKNEISSRFRVRVSTEGKTIWSEASIHSRGDIHGHVVEVSGTIQNITDLIMKENEIQKRQKFLEVILENIPSIIFVKDRKNNYSYSMINKTGEKFYMKPASEVIGKTDFELFPQDLAEKYHKTDEDTLNASGSIQHQTDVITINSVARTISTQKVSINDEKGEPRYVMGISNDITHELETQEALELERAKSIQSSKLATLGELAASVAHEINNPLSIIHGSAILIPRFIDNPEKFKQKVDNVLKAAERISKIVTGLRKFSRVSVNTLNQKHSLAEIIRESILLTENKAKRFSVLVELELKDDITIECNEIEIEQIIINMINNGIDAIKDHDEKWVKLTIEESNEHAILKIRDSGKGINPEIVEKMFNPFFTTKPVGEGTGLGLSIVKGIIEEHHGSIRVVHEDPNTCFEIKFLKKGAAQYAA